VPGFLPGMENKKERNQLHKTMLRWKSLASMFRIKFRNMIDLGSFIISFIQSADYDDIYNEFSLQFELGIFLRLNLPAGCKVQFERNVGDLGVRGTIKKEADLIILDGDDKYSIELKNPRKGAFPMRMGQFIEDVMFAEQLKSAGFVKTFCLTLVDSGPNRAFYQGDNSAAPYCYFRENHTGLLHGNLRDAQSSKSYEISGHYSIEWIDCDNGRYKYYLLEAK
jgi:hypothetical protein